jgi:hypothetical protein
MGGSFKEGFYCKEGGEIIECEKSNAPQSCHENLHPKG